MKKYITEQYINFKAVYKKIHLCHFVISDKDRELFFDFNNSVCKKGRYYYNNNDLKDDRNFLIALGIYDTNSKQQ